MQFRLRLNENSGFSSSGRDWLNFMKDAWDDYARHAWEENELKPVSPQTGQSGGIFGDAKIGATIVDSLDTLHIMGLTQEYENGRAWVAENLNFDTIVSGQGVGRADLLKSLKPFIDYSLLHTGSDCFGF